MHDLKQVQPITDSSGTLMGLIGLDSNGTVYHGTISYGKDSGYVVTWKRIEERGGPS